MNKKYSNGKGIAEIYSSVKDYTYPLLFYIAGLIIGTALFKGLNNTNTDSIISFLSGNNAENGFSVLFFNRLCVYLSMFFITVLLGLCVVGYPVISALPAFYGIITAFKISYYYAGFGVKGIGYSLIMIVPEAAALITVMLITIIKASELSKSLLLCVKNKETPKEINLKAYLKTIIIHMLAIIIIAVLNSSVIYFMSSVVNLQ